jgi:hypothetical protein
MHYFIEGLVLDSSWQALNDPTASSPTSSAAGSRGAAPTGRDLQRSVETCQAGSGWRTASFFIGSSKLITWHGLASRGAAHVTTSQWGMYFLPSDTPRPTALTSDYCSVGPTLTARAATSQRRSEAAATANVEEKGNRRGMLLMMIDRLRASAGGGGSGDDPSLASMSLMCLGHDRERLPRLALGRG